MSQNYIKLNELCKMIRREDFTVFLKAILVGLTCFGLLPCENKQLVKIHRKYV